MLEAIARSTAAPPDETAEEPHALSRSTTADRAPGPKPLIQFAPFPVALDTEQYADAQSTSNPLGELRPLFAFRDFVDPLPSFAQYYQPSGNSTEQIYEAIVNGAVVTGANQFTAGLLEKAKQQFAATSFANMGGTPGVWRPVYVEPGDWYDFPRRGAFKILISIWRDRAGASGLRPDRRDSALAAFGRRSARRREACDPKTTIRSLRMKYMLVSFRRPWFNDLLFQYAGGICRNRLLAFAHRETSA